MDLDRGVLGRHRGKRGDTETRGDGGAHARAGQAVASGVERRSRDHDVGGESLDQRDDLPHDRVRPIGDEPVAAEHRAHDLRLAGQQLLERQARPHGSRARARRRLRAILAADAGEKLVQVVDDPHVSTRPPRRHGHS